MRPCGNPNCYVSTSIDEFTLTFGSGELDEYGFWEKPCYICALAHKIENPESSVWPYRFEWNYLLGKRFKSGVLGMFQKLIELRDSGQPDNIIKEAIKQINKEGTKR
jgi:hypothetical protein